MIVEGTLDMWRIGAGCVAAFGTSPIQEQIPLLVVRVVKKTRYGRAYCS